MIVWTLPLSLAVLLAACKNGPKLTIYASDEKGLHAEYKKRRLSKPKPLFVHWSEATGFTCVAPDTIRAYFKACKQKKKLPDLTECLIKDGVGKCTDGEVLPPVKMVNWACVDQYDYEEFKDYCSR